MLAYSKFPNTGTKAVQAQPLPVQLQAASLNQNDGRYVKGGIDSVFIFIWKEYGVDSEASSCGQSSVAPRYIVHGFFHQSCTII